MFLVTCTAIGLAQFMKQTQLPHLSILLFINLLQSCCRIVLIHNVRDPSRELESTIDWPLRPSHHRKNCQSRGRAPRWDYSTTIRLYLVLFLFHSTQTSTRQWVWKLIHFVGDVCILRMQGPYRRCRIGGILN